MALIDQLKTIATSAHAAADPVAVLYATVTKTSPLTVNVDQRFDLSEDFLVRTRRTKYLVAGDKVILLRVQGGQEYVVLDKVVIT